MRYHVIDLPIAESAHPSISTQPPTLGIPTTIPLPRRYDCSSSLALPPVVTTTLHPGILSSKAKTSDKLKYLWNRVFLKPELYRYSHPFFYKHKIARPILPFYRAVLGVTTQRSKAKNELNAVKKS